MGTARALSVARRSLAPCILWRNSQERATQYSVWSLGRLIGHTDLDYVRVRPRQRIGDLVTTELGAQLLATQAAHEPRLPELQLRGAGGAVVPAVRIAIHDAAHTVALDARSGSEAELLLSDEEAEELGAALEQDAARSQGWMTMDTAPDLQDAPCDDEPAFESPLPRYQIVILLADDHALP